jgi:hypothetical protein
MDLAPRDSALGTMLHLPTADVGLHHNTTAPRWYETDDPGSAASAATKKALGDDPQKTRATPAGRSAAVYLTQMVHMSV